MPLELPTFEKEADVPAPFKSLYNEKDGKWVPKDSGDPPPRSAGEKRLLREKKELEATLEGWKKVLGDKKPEDLAAILEAHAESEGGKDGKSPLAKQVKDLMRQLEEVTAKLKDTEPYKGKYEDRELDIAINEAAVKGGVLAADLKTVRKIVKGDHVRLDPKTSKAIVVDEDGDPTDQPLEKFFAETFKKDNPKFYAGTGGSGGGSTGGNGGGGARTDGKIAITDAKGIASNVDKILKGEVKVAA